MTVDFTHGYQPPGVYVEEEATPLVNSTGLPETLVAIVGPAQGYQRLTQQVALTTVGVTLSKQGIDLTSIVVTRVDDGSTVDPADYTATASGPLTNRDYTTLLENAGGDTPSGDLVFVAYQYTSPAYYGVQRYDNYEDVKDAFGEPLNLTVQASGDTAYQAVLSPLSLAAKIAFENGAGDLVLVATTPPAPGDTTANQKSTSHRAALVAAFTKIETQYGVNVVVPLTDGIVTADAAGVATDLLTHINRASLDGFYRTGVIGFDPSVTTAPDTLLANGAFANKRIMVAYATASGMQFYNGGSNQTLSLGHQYLAAAYAGRMSALPVQKSLTRETIRSFAGVAGVPLSNVSKDQYAAAGIAITEVNRQGSLVVRHGVTTDVSSINTREMSVVRARDAMITLVQTGTENAGLIGGNIDDDTPMAVKSVVAGLLDYAKTSGTIRDYTDLKVRQASVDPSVIEVKFAYLPAYPINYIVISFSINVATGETIDQTNNATIV